MLDDPNGISLDESVLQISTKEKITDLLSSPPQTSVSENDLYQEQRKDLKLAVFIDYLEGGVLPQDEKEARKMVALATKFVILDKVLYFVDHKKTGRRRAAVPSHL